ncbi:Diaminobutyrate--2-oxoglutarate transaminase [Candidatus Desulfarcum epimagneticum]|uniref:Diaminobutyrate--2-oxoglutarate transaminase n=1 Tax=uncultured Desulfobacteraceae bacterium TaxID=218296 RepID=A0A484HEW9_9BACT|nr:Diaminobutyrate--2-oxoglutarate transaminase [uncultured Desulfobacteraceae bacterium]
MENYSESHVLSEREKLSVLTGRNEPGADYPKDKYVYELFDSRGEDFRLKERSMASPKNRRLDLFSEKESKARYYVRHFPALFSRAKNEFLYDVSGNKYIDFLSGAGALNYGHNNPIIKKELIKYLRNDGIIHSLDKATEAKERFINEFCKTILAPRGYDHKIQFTGPTGTNAVEAALKLARMAKKRASVMAFTKGYHGNTLGALAVTANDYYKNDFFCMANGTVFMPYDQYLGPDVNTIGHLKKYLEDSGSGIALPAAVILETIQGEGGINVAGRKWLQDLSALCRDHDILLIIDDIQVGNGRTGTFFSFEDYGIVPDIVVVSKSIGGGLPFSFVLMKPELDVWKPGQHTGTFRGNNLAFVAGAAILRKYWRDGAFSDSIAKKSAYLKRSLEEIKGDHSGLGIQIRGKGLIYGLEFKDKAFAAAVSRKCFQKNLVVETCGTQDETLKILPPLTIGQDALEKGAGIIKNAVLEIKNGKKS